MSLVKLATFNAATERGDLLVRPFRQGSSIRKTAGDMMPEVQDWLSAYKTDVRKIAVLVNALGASEYWGQNSNNDIFPWKALEHNCGGSCFEGMPLHHSGQGLIGHTRDHPFDRLIQRQIGPYGYKTFYLANPFVHHRNKDPNRAFGEVALSVLNRRMRRVELVVLIDRAKANQFEAAHVVDALDKGEFPDVSMGAKIPYDRCSICGHLARKKDEYCEHIKQELGRIYDDGRRVGMINDYPRFFDISFVWVGADRTGKTMAKLASHGEKLWIPQSIADAENVYQLNRPANDQPYELQTKVAAAAWSPKNNAGDAFASNDREEDDMAHRDTTADEAIAALWAKSRGRKREFHQRWKAASMAVGDSSDLNRLLRLACRIGEGEKTADIIYGKDSDPVARFGLFIGTDKDFDRKSSEMTNLFKKHKSLQKAKGAYLKKHPNDFVTAAIARAPLASGAGPSGVVMAGQAGGPDQFEFYGRVADHTGGLADAVRPDGGASRHELTIAGRTKTARADLEAPPLRDKFPYQGRRKFRGLDVLVENVAGTWRVGKGWKTKMQYDYGELPGTAGADGDPVDVYCGPDEKAENVYVVHQLHGFGPKKGQYDEDKVMLGFPSMAAARKAYLAHYNDIGPDLLGSITEMPFDRFRKTVFELNGKEKLAAMGRAAVSPIEDAFLKVAAGVSDFKPKEGDKKQPSALQLKRARIIRDLFNEAKALGKSFDESKLYAMKNATKDPRWTGGSGMSKTASVIAPRSKLGEMEKRIEPEGGLIGRVAAVFREQESAIPSSVIRELACHPPENVLATSAMMGIPFKPEEFQELILRSRYHRPELASALRKDGVVFPMTSGNGPLMHLQPTDWDGDVMGYLLDFLEDRSYLPPVLARRLGGLRITVSKAGPNTSNPESEGPAVDEKTAALLTDVSAAYNAYRHAMIDVAANGSQRAMKSSPKLAFHVLGMTDEDLLMGKAASIDAQVAAPLAAAALALMHSSAARSEIEAGNGGGSLQQLIADNPVLYSLGAAALARGALKDNAVREMIARSVA